MIDIKFKVVDDLKGLREKFDKAIQAGVKTVTEKIADRAKKNAGKIADRPIPKSSTGRDLWERTGELEKSIEATFPTEDSGRIALEPESKPAEAFQGESEWDGYGHRRHQLGETSNDFGDGWKPKNPAEGVIRNDPFLKDAVEETDAEEIAGDFEAAFNSEFK